MGPRKVIIDTDPGIDDINALLLAFSASAAELDIQMVSVTHGNVDVLSCLHNIVSLFHTIDQERTWRQRNGLPLGFDALLNARQKPMVAVGADQPLEDQLVMADFFHGKDGLGGIHESHPHLSPTSSWKDLFNLREGEKQTEDPATKGSSGNFLFTPSNKPAHEAILDILQANEPQTITIIAIGPLTTLALAAAHDPATFLRAAEVVVMGGALKVAGNITPLGEFNSHADAVAAARLYALTSPTPASTMPPSLSAADPHKRAPLPPYPNPLPGLPLTLTLFPLDITEEHKLNPEAFKVATSGLLLRGSPLAAWTNAFMPYAFSKSKEYGASGLAVHDAVCVWYAMCGAASADKAQWQIAVDQDVRVETAGQWTRGACITDSRPGRRIYVDPATITGGDAPGDKGGWRDSRRGNRLRVCTRTPGAHAFQELLLSHLYRHY